MVVLGGGNLQRKQMPKVDKHNLLGCVSAFHPFSGILWFCRGLFFVSCCDIPCYGTGFAYLNWQKHMVVLSDSNGSDSLKEGRDRWYT